MCSNVVISSAFQFKFKFQVLIQLLKMINYTILCIHFLFAKLSIDSFIKWHLASCYIFLLESRNNEGICRSAKNGHLKRHDYLTFQENMSDFKNSSQKTR